MYKIPFGGGAYGVRNPLSDSDFFLISGEYENYSQEMKNGEDLHMMSFSTFQNLLDKHDIAAMEVFFFGGVKECKFELDLLTLRHSISQVVSNSWVKAKKKIAQGDDYIGRKSMWHSVRILMFGIQLAKSGKIYDFTEANCFYDEIVLSETPYDDLVKKFKPIMLEKQSEFRMLAPK